MIIPAAAFCIVVGGSTAWTGVACASPQAGWSDAAKFTATRQAEVDHVAEKPLDVTTDNGAIKVAKGSGDKVQVIAKVRATTQERLDSAKVLTTRAADGTLTVSVQWPEDARKPSEGCDVEVLVPSLSSLKAATSNGAITAKGLSGPATLGTSNASITVNAWDGALTTTTSNGSVDIAGASGPVNATSSNGRVKAVDVQGPVTVKTSNASVDVALKPKAAGPVSIETNNGAVTLKVGPAFVGSLHAQTSNGRVTVRGAQARPVGKPGRDEGTWQFGEGGAPSEIETDNGSVTVEVVESGE